MTGSPYLAAIGSNARSVARGSRLATYPMAQAGPSWRPALTTPQAGPSWMLDTAVTSPLAGRFADGAPKRLKCDECSVFKSLMDDLIFIEYLIKKGHQNSVWSHATNQAIAGIGWDFRQQQLTDKSCIPSIATPSQYYTICKEYKWGPFGEGGHLERYLGYVRDMNVKHDDSDSDKPFLCIGFAEGVFNMYEHIDISHFSAIESADGTTPKQIIVIEDAADEYEFNFIGRNDRLNSTFSYTSDLRLDETWVSEDSWALL